MKRFAIVTISLALTACASSDRSRISDAAVTPLNDLHLVHDSIPPVLLQAQKQPYALPEDRSCDALAAAVLELDEVLGPDVDAPKSNRDRSAAERGGAAVSNAAIGAFKGAAENVIPFRGWVRKLTGAERFSKKVTNAIAAGNTRRSFLRGIGAGQACSV